SGDLLLLGEASAACDEGGVVAVCQFTWFAVEFDHSTTHDRCLSGGEPEEGGDLLGGCGLARVHDALRSRAAAGLCLVRPGIRLFRRPRCQVGQRGADPRAVTHCVLQGPPDDLAALHVKRTARALHRAGPDAAGRSFCFSRIVVRFGSCRSDRGGGSPCRFHGNDGSRGRVAPCPLHAGSRWKRSLTGVTWSGGTTS